jgi:STE24 endopeptidase
MDTESAAQTGKPDFARAFTTRLRWAGEFQFIALFAAIVVFGWMGFHQRAALFAQTITRSFFLQIACCWLPLWALCTAAAFPVACYTFHLQRKFGLLTGGLRIWFRDYLKSNALAFLVGGALLEIAFLSNVISLSFGWVWAGVLYALLFLWIYRSLPWILSLFYPVVPLSNEALRDGIAQLAAKAGVRIGTIYEWRISERTRQANALVTGLGAARRILLTDTLLSQLSLEEAKAIVAHELGHCALHHVAKRFLLQGVIFSLILGGISFSVHNGLLWFADQNLGWTDLKLIPGFFLYWTCGRLYGNFMIAALSRRQEKEADLYAWRLVGRAEPFITGLRKITETNLIVFDKGSQWRYAHPATAERLAAAERFAKANGELAVAAEATVGAGSEST